MILRKILLSEYQKSWDVPAIIPHDDAYPILSLFPPEELVPFIRPFLTSDTGGRLVEPLMALIVDHSRAHSIGDDHQWPKMLSMLVQAEVIDYLIQVAAIPLPDLSCRDYTLVQDQKRDAATGIFRCFEQIQARDLSCVGVDIFKTLESLKTDKTQPLPVQWQAKNSLEVWDRFVPLAYDPEVCPR